MIIKEYLKFLEKCHTPYHITEASVPILKNFIRIDSLKDIKPGRYYSVLEDKIFVAFTIPEKITSIKIYAAHSDSPALKIKENGKYEDKHSLMQLKPHGGGLWHQWFDRPLGLAGLIINREGEKELIFYDKPIAVIPSLPPHLNDCDVYNKGFLFNKDILNAIISLDGKVNLENKINESLAYDLSLISLEKPKIGGINDDLIFGGRQDNLYGSFLGLKSLVDSEIKNYLNIVVIFDDEEIGSETIHGAQSNVFLEFFNKLKSNLKLEEDINQKSIILSCDVAHGYNPNYSNKFMKDNPVLGKGMVIKHSEYYATNIYTTAILKDLAEKHKLSLQYFHKKNSLRGGSTIGPMLVTKLGIKGIDIGPAILAMHSISEVSSVEDVKLSVEFLKVFFNEELLNIGMKRN